MSCLYVQKVGRKMEIRQLKQKEIAQAIVLADRIFRDENQTSMGEAFPHVFTKGPIHSFGAFEGKKLVGFIGLVPATIRVGPSTLDVFSLGAVCTDEAYRGQGISTKILQKVYAYIEEAGASLLFVSGDRGMYTRNHCYHFGGLSVYNITQGQAGISYDGRIRKGRKADIFSIQHIRNQVEVQFHSTTLEWGTLFEASGLASITNKKQSLYVAEQNNEVEGYVVITESRDGRKTKDAFVVETGGTPHVISAILNRIIGEQKVANIIFHVPWYQSFEDFLFLSDEKMIPHSGTVYLINEERLLSQLQAYIAQHTNEKIKIKRENDTSYVLSVGDEAVHLTNELLVDWLFTPQTPRKVDVLKGVLPIPLPNPEGMYFV